MFRPRLIYVVICEVLFIFSFIFIAIHYIALLKQTHLFFVIFLEYFLSLLDEKVDEESKIFQIAKIQLQSIA